jgi:hypothetical protein
MVNVRCVGCGKLICDGEKTVRVATGKSTGTSFTESKEWGRMHEPCFEGSVESPSTTLAKVRKLAKQTVVISPGRKAKHA